MHVGQHAEGVAVGICDDRIILLLWDLSHTHWIAEKMAFPTKSPPRV